MRVNLRGNARSFCLCPERGNRTQPGVLTPGLGIIKRLPCLSAVVSGIRDEGGKVAPDCRDLIELVSRYPLRESSSATFRALRACVPILECQSIATESRNR